MKQYDGSSENFCLLIQKICLQWSKNCRGGAAAAKRNQHPKALPLSDDFFSYHAFGMAAHFVTIWQEPEGFHTVNNCRRLMDWSIQDTMSFDPFEITRQADKIQVRYRYDLHHRAMPRRYIWEAQRKPLNQLAFELRTGDYGQAVCNGRFQDGDTGSWYYKIDILNVMLLPAPVDSLDCFVDSAPNKVYQQMALLW